MTEGINEVNRRLISIESMLKTFIDQLARHDERTTTLSREQGEMRNEIKTNTIRIGRAENRLHWYAGASAIIGAFVAKYFPGILSSHS